MDTDQWLRQGIALANGEESNARAQLQAERRAKPQKEQALNCPRCNSSNTKFCYYNNYSLSQPRYFCKGCRRYWTQGGSLRNVPVGGGSRKNKRSSSSSSSSSSTAATPITQTSLPSFSSFPIPRDLNLSFPTTSSLSALELLRSGISARGLCPIPTGAILGAGFDFQETMRPINQKLPLEGICAGGHGGVMQEERNGGLHFPFEQMKQVPLSNASHGAQGEGDATFFWNGVVCNGGSGGGGEELW